METNIYTFEQDMKSLRYFVDRLQDEVTPSATKRTIEHINRILERIQSYRDDSYVPYDVKQYFIGGSE